MNPHRESHAERTTFRKSGDFWTIAHRGDVFHLRSSKGLLYLSQILAYPRAKLHAVELLAAANDPRSTADLRVDALAAERARQAIRKAIKTAIERITEQSPSLGDHLSTRVRTGVFCSYRPDPGRPIDWEL